VIFVLHDGVIAERGTHDVLLAQNGLYARLYRMQFRTSEAVDAPSAVVLPFPTNVGSPA
jgi:hypothetical protein